MLSLPNGVGADVIVHRKCLPLSTLGVEKYFAINTNVIQAQGVVSGFPVSSYLVLLRIPVILSCHYCNSLGNYSSFGAVILFILCISTMSVLMTCICFATISD